MQSFVKFLFSSDGKTKPLEDTATVKLWKTVALQDYLSLFHFCVHVSCITFAFIKINIVNEL